jgi:hypothetical protein
LGVERFEARMDDDPVIGDLEGVPAAQEGPAAKLADLDVAFGPPAVKLVAQLDDTVDHRVLDGDLFSVVAGQQKRRAFGERCLNLQLVDEAFNFDDGNGHLLRRQEPVEDQERGAPAADLIP